MTKVILTILNFDKSFTNVIVMSTPDRSSREKDRKKEKKSKINPSAANGEKTAPKEDKNVQKVEKSGPKEDKNGNMEQEKCRKRVEQVKELFNNWVKELKPQLTV